MRHHKYRRRRRRQRTVIEVKPAHPIRWIEFGLVVLARELTRTFEVGVKKRRRRRY